MKNGCNITFTKARGKGGAAESVKLLVHEKGQRVRVFTIQLP